MKSLYRFIVKPLNYRYDNIRQVNDRQLIINTSIEDHKFVSKKAVVVSTPAAFETSINKGDEVYVHHNVFRRWHDMQGNEKNSRSYFNENTYLVKEDQIFLYKRNNDWQATKGYCFVQPIKQRDKLKQSEEEECIGIVKYTDGVNKVGELVGFTPFSTYEFIINGKRLYRVLNKFITIKYEYQGDEEAYNPSWAQSS